MSYTFSEFSTRLATAVFAIVLLTVLKSKLSKPPYPPGPKGLPLIGNLRDLPSSSEWITFAKWSHQFSSPIVHLNLLGTHLIVVNSADAAAELFDKRSAIYSDRPRMPMIVELSGLNWAFPLFTYGSTWRLYHRVFHQYFNSGDVVNFEPQQAKAVHQLLYRLVHKPEKFVEYVRLMAGSLTLSVAYGIDVQTIDHPLLLVVEKTVDIVRAAGSQGAFLVDSLPLLKYVPEWFPGAGFKRTAREWRKIVQATADVPMQHVKDQMAQGISVPSIASLSLEQLEGKSDRELEEAIRGVCATIFTAGVVTVGSVLRSFFLAMVLYPDVVRRAQEELDRVVGLDRFPDFTDKPSLPYVNALVKEVLRWNPVAPLAVPHRLMADDIYDGKFMPAGSIVLGNSWAMLHDENVYAEPEVFNPERFLKDGQLNPDVRPPEAFAFGFGRRLCPGRDFALSTIFIAIANILCTFNIEKAIDGNGRPITPSGEYVTGITCYPMPFDCLIKPRSPQVLNLINEAHVAHHPDAHPGSVSLTLLRE